MVFPQVRGWWKSSLTMSHPLQPIVKTMSTTRRFELEDIFSFARVNLDIFTETVRLIGQCCLSLSSWPSLSACDPDWWLQYNMNFYLHYLAQHPEYFDLVESPNGLCMGYVMGKAEGSGENWHGHVTAVTVAPDFRRLKLAEKMMKGLEDISEFQHHGYFVDLFVRVSNDVAVGMYRKFGYSVYRRVIGYYSGEEDAYDMRKALSRDVDKKSVIPLDRPVYPQDLLFP